MKSETSVSVIFPDVVPAIRRTSVSVVVACAVLMSAAVAAENAVRFNGSVVNATCNIQPASQTERVDTRQLEVAQGVVLEVDTSRNACDGQAAPFIARYTPLQVPAPQSSGTDKAGQAGVVTLTYQ